MDSASASLHSFRMVEGQSAVAGCAELERRALDFESELKLQEARDAYEAALQLDPNSQSAAEGRARLAIQLREDGAAEHCARALAFHNSDPHLQLQMIATAATELGAAVTPLLESYIARHPQEIGAHELLADLRAQAGEGESFIDSYTEALSKEPEDKRLLMSFWNMLSRSGRHLQAIESMDARRSLFEGDRDFAILEVAIAGHSGQVDRAERILERLDEQPDAQLARGLNRLQRGSPGEAARFLQGVVTEQPDNFEAWALLELAWRMTGDANHEWLVGRPGLYGPSELDLSKDQLSDIAAALRQLHRASSQPTGQSVRGGTQTAGALFMRSEPEILVLLEALAVAIRHFVHNLPAADPRHPLLKFRNDPIAFGPSWSVRFTKGGHHAAHFHPGGILSSACYISIEETAAGEGKQPGWLEIGRAPAELGIDLPPLATFEPKPGRLVLFPSYLFHGTRPFSEGERLTVAFDLVAVQPA